MKSAEELESYFKDIGRIRQGDPEYANDSGYWTGGHCNWGANHVLKEDCQTLTKGLGKLESLEQMARVLKNTTSKSEFDAKKSNFLTKCDEVIKGLTPSYGTSSSVFGICIIWQHEAMNWHVQQTIDEVKREVENIRSSLSNETYQWVEEINQINLEIRQIEQRMEENKRKAMNEKDPIKRAKLIELIEEDGKLMIQKETKKAQLENRLNFNASSYVNNIIEGMKEVIKVRHEPGGRGGNGNNRTPRTPKDPNKDNDSNDDIPNTPNPNIPNPPNKKTKKQIQNDQQLIVITGIVILIIFYLINQKDQSISNNREEYYDY